MKREWRKQERELYLPKKDPIALFVPKMKFLVISGEGNPNGIDFSHCVEALYGASYTVRMSHKSESVPDGYYEYTVYPLEGVWDLKDPERGSADKENYKYDLMIRQPDFLTEDLAKSMLIKASKKKSNERIKSIRYMEIEEGSCVQLLHLGSYEEEPESFDKIKAFCSAAGIQRLSKVHREIYLTDPRKTAPDKNKTVLRVKVNRLPE